MDLNKLLTISPRELYSEAMLLRVTQRDKPSEWMATIRYEGSEVGSNIARMEQALKKDPDVSYVHVRDPDGPGAWFIDCFITGPDKKTVTKKMTKLVRKYS